MFVKEFDGKDVIGVFMKTFGSEESIGPGTMFNIKTVKLATK